MSRTIRKVYYPYRVEGPEDILFIPSKDPNPEKSRLRSFKTSGNRSSSLERQFYQTYLNRQLRRKNKPQILNEDWEPTPGKRNVRNLLS